MQRDLLNPDTSIEPSVLVDLFYHSTDALGTFTKAEPGSLDPAYETLLDHNAHMTVTVEEYHGSPVDVGVVEVRHCDNYYNRKIVLMRQSDDAVVQFGIVSLNKETLNTHVFEEIMAQQMPLGRILIKNNVLRKVNLKSLYRVTCSAELARYLGVEPGTEVAGRTAVIECDGKPAIGLLEIVTA